MTGLVQQGADAFGHAQRIMRRHVRHQHDELLAAEARHAIRFAQGAADDSGHMRQHLVAHRMTVAVIDQFEVIEVDTEQCQRQTAAPQIACLARIGVAKAAPVQHLRQRIVGRAALQYLLQAPRGHRHEAHRQQQRHEIGDRQIDAGRRAGHHQVHADAAMQQGRHAARQHHDRLHQHQRAKEKTGKVALAMAPHQLHLARVKQEDQQGKDRHAHREIGARQQPPAIAGDGQGKYQQIGAAAGRQAEEFLRAQHRQADAGHQRRIGSDHGQCRRQHLAGAEQQGRAHQQQQTGRPMPEALHLAPEAAIHREHDDAHRPAHQGRHQHDGSRIEGLHVGRDLKEAVRQF
ncbi:hypothetical protein D3C87_1189450 [compost metagenome]